MFCRLYFLFSFVSRFTFPHDMTRLDDRYDFRHMTARIHDDDDDNKQ
jgi:hypothetical protein